MLRDAAYIERNSQAVDEFQSFLYASHSKNITAAAPGTHDDRVLTRAIANYIAYTWPIPRIPPKTPPPKPLPSSLLRSYAYFP
jgi:hypothetical protein